MKTIEEEIWAYIDGTCNPREKESIAIKIASDNNYAVTYKELLKLNELMLSNDLEEPSMSFSRNVMEAVALEVAPKKLKTKVDNRIILGIGAFFSLSILSLLVYAIAVSDISTSDFQMPRLDVNINFSQYLTPGLMKIFLFFDLMLALVYFDRLLRRKNTA
jgi:hypothetical protein